MHPPPERPTCAARGSLKISRLQPIFFFFFFLGPLSFHMPSWSHDNEGFRQQQQRQTKQKNPLQCRSNSSCHLYVILKVLLKVGGKKRVSLRQMIGVLRGHCNNQRNDEDFRLRHRIAILVHFYCQFFIDIAANIKYNCLLRVYCSQRFHTDIDMD